MTDQAPSPWSRPQGPADPPAGGWGSSDHDGQPAAPGGYSDPRFGPGPAGPPAPAKQPFFPPEPAQPFGSYPSAAVVPPPVHPNPYAGQAYPVFAQRDDYAPWGKRVVAMLLDHVATYLGLIVFWIGYGFWLGGFVRSSEPPSLTEGGGLVMLVGFAVMLVGTAFSIYNRWIVAGRTGQSLGKRATKIKLIGEESGAPIGALNAFLRDLVHTLDGFAYVGYLWPLWDQKRQTFSDKLMKTVVVSAEDSTG